MCGRYSFETEIGALITAWKLAQQRMVYEKQEEVRPTDRAPVLFSDGQLRLLRWGFSPAYTKAPLINARGETAVEKRTFRNAFLKRRCIVPATGFYEWKKGEGKQKEKHLFQGEEPFLAMAGLWEVFLIDGEETPCFTILTTAATDAMEGIHDRMPVLLQPQERTLYLNHRALSDARWKEMLKQQEIRLYSRIVD